LTESGLQTVRILSLFPAYANQFATVNIVNIVSSKIGISSLLLIAIILSFLDLVPSEFMGDLKDQKAGLPQESEESGDKKLYSIQVFISV
jgi:hypothetical protein